MTNVKIRRKHYKITFKLRIINDYEINKNISFTAKKYNLSRKTVRQWLRNKESFLETFNKRDRSRVTRSSDAFYPDLEAELNYKIVTMRRRGVNISGELILAHARRIAISLNLNGFIGTQGWLHNFLKS